MGRSQRSSEDEKCECGRPDCTARVANYRTNSGSYRYHRSDCGSEWTERLIDVDPSEPVSGEEVLDVHLLLAGFDGRLTDLIDPDDG